MLEHEARAFAGGRIERLHGVGQAAGLAHDGDRAVAQAEHLVQAAGLVARRHEQHVCTGLDQVSQLIIVAAVERRLAREGLVQPAEELLVAPLPGAEYDQA